MRGLARGSAAIGLLIALLLIVLTGSAAAGAEPAAPAGSGLITEIQKELNRLGYRAGKMDGILKEGTRRAIRNFERVHGRKATGQPSQALLDEIRQPCEIVLDERGYKKAQGGCPRPSAVSDLPDVYLLEVGRGEQALKLEPLEPEEW
jgi:peptidoglycan hydrolase-like protein with peptidoglycan-binding domain